MLGNSDEQVLPAAYKRADSPERVAFLLDQAEYLAYLAGEGVDCVPRVLAMGYDGYAMELLEEHRSTATSAIDVWSLLQRVWSIPEDSVYWRSEYLGAQVPDWVASEPACTVHGDATLANLMRRSDRSLVLIDPIPPTIYPSVRSIDLAAILQSCAGWELLLRRTESDPEEMVWPLGEESALDVRRALWWLGIKARRIALRERRRVVPRWRILEWCDGVERGVRQCLA